MPPTHQLTLISRYNEHDVSVLPFLKELLTVIDRLEHSIGPTFFYIHEIQERVDHE